MPGVREKLQPVLKPFKKLFGKKKQPAAVEEDANGDAPCTADGEQNAAAADAAAAVDKAPAATAVETNGHADESTPAAGAESAPAAATAADVPTADGEPAAEENGGEKKPDDKAAE